MLTFSTKSLALRVRHRLLTISGLVLVAGAVAAMGACKGLTSVDASFDNISDSLKFYSLNGSPPGTATAINLFTGVPYRADETFAYDIAFDIDAAGRAVLIPARALATGFSSPYSVGLLPVTGSSFAAVDRAPKSGYVADSALAVAVGTVVVIESHNTATCSFAIKGQSYFSKLVVTAVDVATRRISLYLTVNRNCGFRSFADGKPKD